MSNKVLIKITLWVNVWPEVTNVKLREYIDMLGRSGLEAYAGRCSVAESYMRIHVKYGSKNPSVSLIKALNRESQGNVSLNEVLEHFGIVEKGN